MTDRVVMADMSKFTTKELLDDLSTSNADIVVCELALKSGITETKSGEDVLDRLRGNKAIVAAIKAELERRIDLQGKAQDGS